MSSSSISFSFSVPPSISNGHSVNGTSLVVPQTIPSALSTLSTLGVELSRRAILRRLEKAQRERGAVDMEITQTEATLAAAEQQLRQLQEKVESCKAKIPTLQVRRDALRSEELSLNGDLAILPQVPSLPAPESSSTSYTIIDGFTFAASSLPPPPVEPPATRKRSRSPEKEVDETSRKKVNYIKPEFELLQECFPIGTTVYHKGRPATIEGFTAASFLIKMGDEVQEVEAQALVYVPKEGEVCLVKGSPKGAQCKYYFAKVIKIERAPQVEFISVRLTIEWVDSNEQETRDFRVLDRLIPIGPENPIVKTLKQRVETNEQDPSQNRTVYYLTRQPIEVSVPTG